MIDRIKLILDYYNLSASTFADMIDVPRSSISHLLSGRNKPSLDFVVKVEKAFDEIELDWLVYGRGTFPKSKSTIISKEVKSPNIESPSLFNENPVFEQQPEKKSNTQFSGNEQKGIPVEKRIKNIVVLYDDGTFDDYKK
ncbi:hypothetical protein WH52_00930 [Tenacibaculum holothuriorum]|uniref:HTH cro/C1-type domain-containing protein n=1 Tax=Tenacibaculum holothuriorum TaxID=1635173 RepID=A0A1Y2PFJ1_9FLAO|nr:helix-turn-helix transcriptional regulator [Tenacibaculum holothuriorum]OSY89242.1 hypothetical protein WH52_00930 [Tenacibaculum holothuriorum]